MRRHKKSLWSNAAISVILSAFIGLATSAVCAGIAAAVIYFFLRDMGLAGILTALSLAVGSFTGSYICGRYRRRRGALNGLICGAVMFAVLLAVGTFLSVEAAGIKKLLLLAAAGCTGGVYGVNSKRPLSQRDQ